MVPKLSHSYFHNFDFSFDEMKLKNGFIDLELISSSMLEEQLFVRESMMGKLISNVNKLVKEGQELELEISRLNKKVQDLMGVICESVESTKVCETKETQTEFINPLEKNKMQTDIPAWSEGTSIEEEVKAIASEVVEKSGYKFDETTGLYYDERSGYYYDAETSLYYDGKTGTYFYYDHESQSYKFHSYDQATLNEKSKSLDQSQKIENGEELQCSSASIVDFSAVDTSFNIETSKDLIAPSLRLMVMNGELAGNLHLITKDGATIGSGPENFVSIDDKTISNIHAKIIYKSEDVHDHHYYIKDCGSNAGTFLNGKRLSKTGNKSKNKELVHGWGLSCGNVSFTIHIHPGHLTCNECEPGLVIAKLKKGLPNNPTIKENLELKRRDEVKTLRKKHGLEYHKDQKAFNLEQELPTKYRNRAKVRRKVVGSDNPYEKTQIASVETSIPSSNKGFKLMQKMGWSDGDALGSSQKGRIEPIIPSSTLGRTGLGAMPDITADPTRRKSANILSTTKSRYNALCENETVNDDTQRLKAVPFLSAGKINTETNDLRVSDGVAVEVSSESTEENKLALAHYSEIKNLKFSLGEKAESDNEKGMTKLKENEWFNNDNDHEQEESIKSSNGRRGWGAMSHTKKIWTPQEGVAAKINALMGPKIDSIAKNETLDIFSSDNTRRRDNNKNKFKGKLLNRKRKQQKIPPELYTIDGESPSDVDCITLDTDDTSEVMIEDEFYNLAGGPNNISTKSNHRVETSWNDSQNQNLVDDGWCDSRLRCQDSSNDKQENTRRMSHHYEDRSMLERPFQSFSTNVDDLEDMYQVRNSLIESGWKVS